MRNTPYRDPQLYDRWLESYTDLLRKGPPTHATAQEALSKIAQEYGVSRRTVARYLKLGEPDWALFNLHLYLAQHFSEGEEFSLLEISKKIPVKHRDSLSEAQIQRALESSYVKRFGMSPAVEVGSGMYRRNKLFKATLFRRQRPQVESR